MLSCIGALVSLFPAYAGQGVYSRRISRARCVPTCPGRIGRIGRHGRLGGAEGAWIVTSERRLRSIEDIGIVAVDKFEFPFHSLGRMGFHVTVGVSGIGVSELAREGMSTTGS